METEIIGLKGRSGSMLEKLEELQRQYASETEEELLKVYKAVIKPAVLHEAGT